MSCGCKCRPSRHTMPAPCTDCGPYGSTCCLKMTGLGETWYFRTYIDGPFNPDSTIGALAIRWVDGDDCVPLTEFESQAYYLGWGQQSNLCGSMTTAGPCSDLNRFDTFGGTGDHPEQQSLIWRVSEDCSEVAFTLYYYDADNVLTRYYGTAPTNWLVSGTPVTIGPFTITTCPSGEPARKQYNICCWQSTADTALCSMTARTLPEGEPLPASCESDPRHQIHNTEQCGNGSISGAEGDCESLLHYRYEVSNDYSVVTLYVSGVVKLTGSHVYFTEDGGPLRDRGMSTDNMLSVTIPFTSDWFLTPITINATGCDGAAECEWEGATLTLSVCGHIDDAETCMPECMIHRYTFGGVDYIYYRPLYMAVDSFQDPQPCCNDQRYEEVPLYYYWGGTNDPDDPLPFPGGTYDGYYNEMFQRGSCAGLRVWIWCDIGSPVLHLKVIAHHPGSFSVPSFTTTLTEDITLECDEDGEVSNEGSEVSINKPWCNETGHSEAQHYIRILIYSQNAGIP